MFDRIPNRTFAKRIRQCDLRDLAFDKFFDLNKSRLIFRTYKCNGFTGSFSTCSTTNTVNVIFRIAGQVRYFQCLFLAKEYQLQ